MADKSILSRLRSRPSFDNSSVEITIIEPQVRCLQSISSNSYSKHHHCHHQKKTEQKKWEVREDLQKKMKEVKQKITELEAQGYQESVCRSSSISKKQHDYLKRSSVTGYPSGTLKVLSRSISEGALLQRRKKRLDCQKLYPSRKSIVCQACNLRLSQQEELLRFVSAQHQQVLHMMHEIKAELQVIKNDKMQEHNYKRKAESLTILQTNGTEVEPLPTTEHTCHQQQDPGHVEGIKQICNNEQEGASKDSSAHGVRSNEIVKTENSVTALYPEEQHENKLPTVRENQMQKNSKRKENVECIHRVIESSQKNLLKQNGNSSNQYNTDNDANLMYSAKHTTKVSSYEANIKCNVPQPTISKDTRILVGQRKLHTKSFLPEMANKFKDFPQKETLAPLNRLNPIKQADKSTNPQQKTVTNVCGSSKSYGHKDDLLPKNNPNRQIKSLRLLRACHPRQIQHQDKDDINNAAGTKEDWKISDNNRNIPTISHSSKVNNMEDDSHDFPGGLINESDSSPTSQICFEPSSDINVINQVNLSEKKEAIRYQDSSTSTELEIAELTSKNQGRKHKLGKILRTKKDAIFVSSGTSPSSKPPRLNRASPSSLTFVIERSKSKTAGINQEDRNILRFPENDTSCQYNTTDATTAPKQAVCTSHYVHSTSYTTPSLSFGGKCNIHTVPDSTVVRDMEAVSTERNLGRVLTKKSISYNRTLSAQNHNSSDKISSPKGFCCMEQQKDNCTLADNLRKMLDVQDNVNSEVGTAAAEKGPIWEHSAPGSEIPRNVPGNYMQQSYMNPNFNFIPTSEACITPRYVDLGPQDKPGSNPSTRFEPVGSEDDMQEIELSLSFDDLEYLLLHKIRKQELKHDASQVEALRRTLNAVRQCFKAQQEFLQDSSEVLDSPKQTLSCIKTVILSPRNFASGQHIRIFTG